MDENIKYYNINMAFEIGVKVYVRSALGILQTKGTNPFWGYQESLEFKWPEVPIIEKYGKIYNCDIDNGIFYGIIFDDGTIGHRIKEEDIILIS